MWQQLYDEHSSMKICDWGIVVKSNYTNGSAPLQHPAQHDQPGWRPAARRIVRGWNICSELEMINAGVTRNKQPITQPMASPSTVNTVNCSTAYLPSSQPLISTSHCLHFTFTFTSYCACHVCQFDNVRSVCVSLYISNSNTIYYLRLLCWISHLNHHISGKQMGVY